MGDETGAAWLHQAPPGRIDGRSVTVRRWTTDDVDALVEAIDASREALVAWMPWADASDRASVAEYLDHTIAAWDRRDEFTYGMFEHDGRLVGSVGLHARIDAGGLEIGYWVRTSATGRRYATVGAALVTAAGLALDGVTHVEIRHDRANERSGRIPRRLGFAHVATVEREPDAPAATGVALHWRMTTDGYTGSPAARVVFDETIAGDGGPPG